jgi:hypothetical protein
MSGVVVSSLVSNRVFQITSETDTFADTASTLQYPVGLAEAAIDRIFFASGGEISVSTQRRAPLVGVPRPFKVSTGGVAVHISRMLRISGFSLLLGHTAAAGVVFVAPNSLYTTIDAAIVAASDGDVILVKPGTYSGFTLVDKSLWIIAETASTVEVVNTAKIQSLSAEREVVVRGLKLLNSAGPASSPGLEITNCLGPVRIEGCTIAGRQAFPASQYYASAGGPGAVVTSSARVAFLRGTIDGGDGFYSEHQVAPSSAGNGLTATNSSLALYDCQIEGGIGGSTLDGPGDDGGNGGHGVAITGGELFASGCEIRGGKGGNGGPAGIFDPCGQGGNGGHGLSSTANAKGLDNVFVGASGGGGCSPSFGGTPGVAISGSFVALTGNARHLRATTPVAEGNVISYILGGKPNDAVLIEAAPSAAHQYVPQNLGVLLLGPSTTLAALNLDSNGFAVHTYVVLELGSGVEAEKFHVQGYFTDGTSVVLSSASEVVLLDSGLVPPPVNDLCASAITIGNGLTAGSNVGAQTDAPPTSCAQSERDVWYRYQPQCNGLLTVGFCAVGGAAGFDTTLEVFRGSCGSLVPVGCSDDHCGSLSEVQIPVSIGETIYIAVGGKNGVTGSFTLSCAIGCNPTPPNDECSGAIAIGTGLHPGSNVDSTTSAITGSCGSMGSDVWYRFQAPSSGLFSVGFCAAGTQASFDTVLALFSGACTNLSAVVCSDDVCGTGSSASVTLTVGETVFIAVGAKNSAQGTFTFRAEFIGNDSIASAITVSEGLIDGNTAASVTNETITTACGGTNDVWFSYRPTCTGFARIGFCGPGAGATGFDPVLSVHSTAYGAMTEVACADDRCGVLPDLTIPVVAGQQYLVRVAGKTSAKGPFTLAITCQPGTIAQTQLLALSNTTGTTKLVRIESFPWSSTTVGSTGFNSLRGLEYDSATGDLFAGQVSSGAIPIPNASLYRLNPVSGVATSVGITTTKGLAGLAVAGGGNLFASVVVASTLLAPPSILATISGINGATTILGPFDPAGTIKDIQGLAIHPVSSVLYGTTGPAYDGTPGDLFTLDKSTGAATLVGSIQEFGTGSPVQNVLGGLAIDSAGAMYGSLGNNDGRVIVIDPSTLTFVAYGDAGGVSLDGLAAPCPGNELYGKGCAGSGGFTPLLTVAGCSNQGSTITLSIRNALGGSMALLALGLAPSTSPLSANCTLNVAPLLPITITLPMAGAGAGNGSISFPSVLPAVSGPVSITLQALVGDAAAPKGIAASNGFRLDVR